ncbi:MAG: oligosaccharide flippase family protein, partial [Christensenellaceae bacterium]|nr:oligosaccharide flippase family protein [Christensenellaceae bacterium]
MINLISTMLLSRFRTPYEYGTYSQILIAVNLAVNIFSLGLPNSINYFFARAEKKYDKQKFLYVYFLFATLSSLIAGLFLLVLMPKIELYFHNFNLHLYSYVFFLLPLSVIIIQSNSNILIVVGKSSKLVIYTFLHNASRLLAILFVFLFKFSFSTYMLLYMLIEIAFTTIVYIWAIKIGKFENIKTFKVPIYEIQKLLKQMLNFSIPLGLGSMVSTISLELDKLIIGNLMGTESLAIYTNAAKELPFVIIASAFTAVLMPKLSKMLKKNEKKEAVMLWGDSLLITYTLLCFLGVAIIVFAPQVIIFLYSEKYIAGVNVFRVYTLVLIMRSTYFGIILNISGNTKKVFYSSIMSLLLNIILNYSFFYIFGFIGPAIATFVCILLVNSLQLIFTSKITEVALK